VSPQVARSLWHLGRLAELRGRTDEAREHHRRGLEIQRSVYGPRHPDVASSLMVLALLEARNGETDAAEPLHDEAQAIYRETAGSEGPFVLYDEARYAALLGRSEQALDYLRRAVASGP
ncbi:MAG: tetratricopeptide repeat protein, partial [Gammaproteobacteria bacterium]|nr:tetratricopeptide repeat protein [Gammaproteobacteria bacterium]